MHPDYGIHSFQIHEVLAFAEQQSVRIAAETFRLHVSTVYRWRRRSHGNGSGYGYGVLPCTCVDVMLAMPLCGTHNDHA